MLNAGFVNRPGISGDLLKREQGNHGKKKQVLGRGRRTSGAACVGHEGQHHSRWAAIVSVSGKTVRGRAFKRTTVTDEAATRPLDLVKRNFKAERPNQLWVADLTYVPTWSGFVYVAFVTDAFSRAIVGWSVSTSLQTDLVLEAPQNRQVQALQARKSRENLIHHSEVHHSTGGRQYLSVVYTQRLLESKVASSVRSVGDSYDNALAETMCGLYKTELIEPCGPRRNRKEVEWATFEWVDWFNNQRLFEPIG